VSGILASGQDKIKRKVLRAVRPILMKKAGQLEKMSGISFDSPLAGFTLPLFAVLSSQRGWLYR
jgi:hypothetical protein